jgi:tetratricopeptide (TPR) repeat protein
VKIVALVTIALMVAAAAGLWSSDWGEEVRLRRMSPAALEAAAPDRSWDPLILYYLGLARSRRGDHFGAAAALARAAGADPKLVRAHRALSQELVAVGRLAEAEIALRRAAELDCGDRETYLALGELYRRVGALDAAIPLLEQFLRRRPGDLEVMFRLAECYGERFQADRRLALLERVVRHAPRVARYQTALGSAYAYFGRLPEAEHCFQRAIEAAPADAEPHYQWGRTLVEQGDDAALSDAERELEEAARLRPRHADTQMALGELHLRRGELTQTREALAEALLRGGAKDRALLLMGQTLLRLGQEAEGRRFLEAYRRTTDLSRGIVQLENRVRNAPGDRAARLRLVRLYAADHQPERAAYQAALARTSGGVQPADPVTGGIAIHSSAR